MTARVERVVTSGVFSLDGQDFDVDNNVWLVGDDAEVIVVDAAHDAAPDPRGRCGTCGARDRVHARAQRPHHRSGGPRRSDRRSRARPRRRPHAVGRRQPGPRARAARGRSAHRRRRDRARGAAHAGALAGRRVPVGVGPRGGAVGRHALPRRARARPGARSATSRRSSTRSASGCSPCRRRRASSPVTATRRRSAPRRRATTTGWRAATDPARSRALGHGAPVLPGARPRSPPSCRALGHGAPVRALGHGAPRAGARPRGALSSLARGAAARVVHGVGRAAHTLRGMKYVYEAVVVLHFIGLAMLVGGFIAQSRSTPRLVSRTMFDGAMTQLLTGLILVGMRESSLDLGEDDLDRTKIAVKLGIALVVADHRPRRPPQARGRAAALLARRRRARPRERGRRRLLVILRAGAAPQRTPQDHELRTRSRS